MYSASAAIDLQRVLHCFRVLIHSFRYAADLPSRRQLYVDFIYSLERKAEIDRKSPASVLEDVLLCASEKTDGKQRSLSCAGDPPSDLHFVLRHKRVIRAFPIGLVLQVHL